MENILVSFNTVFPLFLLMVTGFFLRRKGYLNEVVIDAIDTLVYHIFLPCMLFDSVYNNTSKAGPDIRLMTYSVISLIALFITIYFAVTVFTHDNRRRGALAHGIFRSNTIVFGIPLSVSLIGNEETSQVMLALGLLICLSNILGVAYLEIFKNVKPRLKKMIISLITNPIIFSLILAILFKMLPFRIPNVLMSPIKSLGGVTSTIAFLVLGATFTLKASLGNIRELIFAVIMKTVLIPVIFVVWLGAVVLGFRGHEIVVLLCLFATPTAVSTYPAAKKMGADGVLAGDIVVFTTACSIITLFFIILLLKELGFI